MHPRRVQLIPLLAAVLMLVVPGAALAAEAAVCDGGVAFRLPDGSTACSHGDDTPPPPVPQRYARELTTAAQQAGGTVQCTGDGTSGNRIQMLYVVAADRPNNASVVVQQMAAAAAEIDELVRRSSEAMGADLTVRWTHDASCRIEVETVVVSPNGDDDFQATMNALGAAGYDRPDRHYLAWVDDDRYCGIAASFVDDRPSESNYNNGGISLYARVDRGCWNAPVSLHELTHMLGAVQRSAPHATDYGHCTDEYDIMCYPDGPGSTMVTRCPDQNLDVLLDCGGDDYFNPQPSDGSYLSSHWNVADSSFLAEPDAPPPPDQPSDPDQQPDPEPEEPPAFEDVPSDHTFAGDISWLSSAGITKGCNPPTNDQFCPERPVSRAQMAAFLNRALPGALPLGKAFSDVEGSVFEDDVRRLAGAGITRGCEPDRFCPDERVTRGQMAAFLVRAFDLPAAGEDFFGDDDESIFEAEINALAAAGITSGCAPDAYCADAPVTRGQMAAFLRRAAG